MEFRVLGPLEAVDDLGAALPLGGPTQRLVLASLVLEAGRAVSVEQLIDRVWGDEPPEAARATLSAYVSRLRRVLGSGRITARAPGYVLEATRDEVDLQRFTDLVAEARRATDRATTARLLAEALELWRGDALSDLATYDGLRPWIARLEESRLGALEEWIAAELDLGRHAGVLSLLEGLTGEHPLRERFWALLVLALYRSGRQGDALGAFHRARRVLVEELGIDPSPELRDLHDRVLRQDPGLAAPSVVGTAPVDGMRSPASDPRPARRQVAVGAGLALAAVLAALAATAAHPGRGGHAIGATVKVGVTMPLSGPRAAYGTTVANAVRMAVDDVVAAGGAGGFGLQAVVLDDAADEARATRNAEAMVADPAVAAMIGPWGSGESFPVLPVTNAAGLFQCGPAATHPGLTKPRFGALDLRPTHPDARNFVRLAPADDIQSVALATFAFHDLAARSALVVDDAADGRPIADAFEREFAKLGGRLTRRALNPDAAPRSVLGALAEELDPPRLVFYAGDHGRGADLRLAMAEAGRLSTPLLSWDALIYGSAGGSYLERVGASVAAGTYAAHASLPDQKFSWADAYRRRFGAEPDEYAAAGYACAEIVASALGAASEAGIAEPTVREFVRSFAVDPARRYETVLGTVAFDANGDALRQFVTFYRIDASAAQGAGEWVISKKQDFGPAP